MPAGQLDLNPVVDDRRLWWAFLFPDNLDRQKAGISHEVFAKPKPRIPEPLEDQISIHIVAPRNLADRHPRHPRLRADHPLLAIRPNSPFRRLATSDLDSVHHPVVDTISTPQQTAEQSDRTVHKGG